MKSAKTQITRESILNSITDGAKSLTAISKAHGYIGSVSGNISAKIKSLVPDVAERMAGKVAQVSQPVAPVAVQPEVKTVKAVKAPAVAVAQRKVYGGMYGAVFVESVLAGEVVISDFVPKVAQKIISSPVYAKVVGKIKAKTDGGDPALIKAVEKAIWFAIGVLRSPKHLSNMGRSHNVADRRGVMQIEAVEG